MEYFSKNISSSSVVKPMSLGYLKIIHKNNEEWIEDHNLISIKDKDKL